MSILDRFTQTRNADIELDVALDILRNQRRRLVFDAVEDSDQFDTRDIADAIASAEADGQPTSNDRKKMYVAMYQAHLPKLVDAGVLDETSPGTYVKGDAFDEAREVLEALREVTV